MSEHSKTDIAIIQNIIANNYFGIDPDEVFQIARKDLPELYSKLLNLI